MKTYTVIDMHGVRMRTAIAEFERQLKNARLGGSSITVRFITGQGEIRQKFIELSAAYDLECFDYDEGNLVITFE